MRTYEKLGSKCILLIGMLLCCSCASVDPNEEKQSSSEMTQSIITEECPESETQEMLRETVATTEEPTEAADTSIEVVTKEETTQSEDDDWNKEELFHHPPVVFWSWLYDKKTTEENGIYYQDYSFMFLSSKPEKVYSKPTVDSTSVELPVWTPVYAFATDREHWVGFRTQDHTWEGWVYVTSVDCDKALATTPDRTEVDLAIIFNCSDYRDYGQDPLQDPGAGNVPEDNEYINMLALGEAKAVLFRSKQEAWDYYLEHQEQMSDHMKDAFVRLQERELEGRYILTYYHSKEGASQWINPYFVCLSDTNQCIVVVKETIYKPIEGGCGYFSLDYAGEFKTSYYMPPLNWDEIPADLECKVFVFTE